MRIVAGERKGARLVAPRGAATRPTSDRAREALFGLLGDVSGLRMLDLFAGSGALGLEALSRGAAHCDFCETSAAALRSLRENIERLGYADRSTVRRQDARRRLAADAAAGRVYDLLLLDPPYRMLPALQAALTPYLPDVLVPRGIAVVESSAGAEPPDVGLRLDTTRTYGEARITVYSHA